MKNEPDENFTSNDFFKSAKKTTVGSCGYKSGRIGLILPDPDRHPAVQFDPGTGNTNIPVPTGRYFIRKSLKMFERLAADLVFMLKICAY